jgi:16S rRNA (cytosine967-C5)-methyltransferase
MLSAPAQPPLWQLLLGVVDVIKGVRAGQSWSGLSANTDPLLKPGVQSLSFAVLRELGWAESVRTLLVTRPAPPAADALLCAALALAKHDAGAPYTAHTLVDQTVEAAKRLDKAGSQASFINACLRRFLREREPLSAAVATDWLAQWNHPVWWIKQLRKDHPQHWQSILRNNNLQPRLVLRVNQAQQSVATTTQAFAAAGIECAQVGPQALALTRAQGVHGLPGFAQGSVSVQDAGAQMAAQLLLFGLTDNPKLRVLDACAAPGGKTVHLLELAPHAELLALDIDPQRCARVHDNLKRAGVHAQVQTGDAAHPEQWWDGVAFDAILLDAPCTASGIVRRHPDVRWLRRETDIAQLATIQTRLLDALWPLVKPGGRLLYCTCSVFKAEGVHQAESFLARNTDAHALTAPGHLLPQTAPIDWVFQDNQTGEHDGFFYALFEKRAH